MTDSTMVLRHVLCWPCRVVFGTFVQRYRLHCGKIAISFLPWWNCFHYNRVAFFRTYMSVTALSPCIYGSELPKRFCCHGSALWETDYANGLLNFDNEKEELCDDGDDTYKFLHEYCSIPDAGHNVLVLQPAVKWGPKKNIFTTPELQLDELCALVSTLPCWKVVRKRIVPVKFPDSERIFGSGTFSQLKIEVTRYKDVSAVVVGKGVLRKHQLSHLTDAWKLPVFDRSRVMQIQQGHGDNRTGEIESAGGASQVYISTRKMILKGRQLKLEKALEDLKKHRRILRLQRQQNAVPTVAVVGYTNSGKTTLIKALTGDRKMKPSDRLFATLDVTAHRGRLANNMKAVYVDTVGFISDIPVFLFNAFAATLEDALLADIVVHVRDISHPNTVAQKVNVLQTLSRMLSQQQMSSMIEVCNKVDRFDDQLPNRVDSSVSPFPILISATSGLGLDLLKQRIQDCLMKACSQMEKTLCIPMRGPMLTWLFKECTVNSCDACPSNAEFLIVNVIITEASYARFRKTFRQTKASV